MFPEAFWGPVRDVATIAILCLTVWATIHGPARALKIQGGLDEAREKQRRQFGILHSLMKTRAWTLHPDHVSALNLIQLEFDGEAQVQEAFRRYLELLNGPFPSVTDEDAQTRFSNEKRDRFFTLVKSIADVLGYKFDKADLERLSYSPQGWANDEAQQRSLRISLIELLEGKRPLPVSQFHLSQRTSMFPPPPGATSVDTSLPLATSPPIVPEDGTKT